MVTVNDRGTTTESFSVENLGKREYGDKLIGWERRNSLGNFYLFKTDETGVYRTAVRNEIELEMKPDIAKLTRFVLKQPLAKGTTWQVDTVPYILRRSFEWPYELKYHKPFAMQFEITETDAAVKVQAGEFKNCLVVSGSHLMRIYIDPMQGFGDIPITQKEWYCPEVGLVKMTRQELVKSIYYFGGSQSFELVEFSKG